MKDAYYFSHDSNARNDPKILDMLSHYGIVGYGWFWILVEMLREQETYSLKLSKCNVYAMQMQCTSDEATKYIQDCINEFELFQSDKEYFWSDSLINRMKLANEKSEKRRNAANSRWNKQSTCNADAMQCNKRKEKKVNESKGKETKVTTEDVGKNPFNFFSQNIGPITPFQSQFIDSYINDEVSEELIVLILQESIGKDNPWHWFKTVLENSFKQNIKSIVDYEAKKVERKRQWERDHGIKNTGKPANAVNFKQREYEDSYFDELYEDTGGKSSE